MGEIKNSIFEEYLKHDMLKCFGHKSHVDPPINPGVTLGHLLQSLMSNFASDGLIFTTCREHILLRHSSTLQMLHLQCSMCCKVHPLILTTSNCNSYTVRITR